MKLVRSTLTAIFACITATTLHASSLGTPLFTTAPADISVVNSFAFGGQLGTTPFGPFRSYDVSVSTTIASTSGLPGLVGQTLEFTYGVENDVVAGGVYSLRIGGRELLIDPLSKRGEFLFSPPIATEENLGGDVRRYTYEAPFTGFGPREGMFPEFVMAFSINQGVPLRQGYESCNADVVCEFSNAPLTEIAGKPVVNSINYFYPEGTVENGTITFFTPGGPPLEAIPLPASAFLLMGAIGLLGFARRQA